MTAGATHHVAVVGAGVIGLATARELALRGVRVTVLERGMVASGTSSRGEGNMLISDKTIPAEAALALRSAALWRDFAGTTEDDFEYEPKGGIVTAAAPRQLDLLTAQAAAQRSLGIESTVLTPDRLAELEPHADPDLAGGIFYPQDAQVMPIKAVQVLARDAVGLGAELRTSVAVTELRAGTSGPVVVLGTGEDLAVDAVVLAAGPWSGNLARRLGGRAVVFPRRGLLLVTEPLPEGTVRHKVYDGRYVEAVGSDAPDAQVAPVVEATRAGTILIGSTREAVGWDDRVRWDLAGDLARDAVALFPGLGTVSVIRGYQGFRPATPDHLPLIGPDARVAGLFHHTGHEGAGIGLALGSAELLAEAVLEGSVDPAFDPRRFDDEAADRVGRPVDRPLALRPTTSADEGQPARFDGREGAIFCGIGHCHACVVSDPSGRTVRSCLAPVAGPSGASVCPPSAGTTPREAVERAGRPVSPADVDVLVVGAGPGGVAAAAQAARAGLAVVVVDRYDLAGGQIRRPARVAGHHLTATTVVTLRRLDEERRPFEAVVDKADGIHLLRADTVVLATGAREVVAPFPGWTLPGVVTAGAVQAAAKQHGSIPWRRVGLAGSGPLVMAVADTMRRAGRPPVFTLERRLLRDLAAGGVGTALRFPAKAALFARLAAPRPPRFGWRVVEAVGDDRLTAAVITPAAGPPGRTRTIPLDALAVSYGLIPDVSLALQLGCHTQDSDDGVATQVVVDAHQRTSIDGVFAVGELTGVGGADKATVEGRLAGAVIAGRESLDQLQQDAARWRRFAADLQRLYPFDHDWARTVDDDVIVCRCERTTAGAVRQAITDGAHTARAVKGLTRCGMGRCQAAVCSPLLRSALWTAGYRTAGHLESRPLVSPLTLDQVGRLG